MKVLIADPISKHGLSILSDSGLNLIIKADSSLDEKLSFVKDVDGIIIRSGTKVDYKMLKTAKRLKVIGRAGVGIDNIDLAAATRKGVVVIIARDKRVFINNKLTKYSDIFDRFQKESKIQPNGTVVIRADRDVAHGFVVKVMDIVKQAGFPNLAIATEPVNLEK